MWLPPQVQAHRLAMCKEILRGGHAPAFWSSRTVWFDPCSSILPGSEQQYEQMQQALRGNKRYQSDDAKAYSRNLRGRVTATKQRTWSGTKVNWFVVLARGKVHVEVMPEDWELTGAGLAQFVHRLPGILRKMLGPGAPLPRNLFTDRGTGLYSSQGFVVGKYESAVRQEGFSLYWGPDASAQAPDMGDLLLHETAVAWLRRRLRSEKPAVRPWEGTCEQWTERVRKVVRGINADYDVRGLCNEFPGRLAECVAKRGDRLRK